MCALGATYYPFDPQFEVLSWGFLKRIEDNHEIPHSGYVFAATNQGPLEPDICYIK
jgi:hypothetical protein